MRKLNLVALILFLTSMFVFSQDKIQTNHVLVIAGADDYLLPTAKDIYYLANNIANLENIYWVDNFDSLKNICNKLSLKSDEHDLVLFFMIGHGKGYASDPQNPFYGFSAVKPIISDTALIGFGKPFRENEIAWWGPRINSAYPRPRCVGLNKKDFFLRGNPKTQIFEGYGVKFVANINKLELADGTIVDDHSDWVKVIYYYAKCDVNQDTLFEYEAVNVSGDNQINGDDVGDIAFKVDTLINYSYGKFNIDNQGTRDYMFITRTDSEPKIAISLNPNIDDFSKMPIHGIVSEDGYIHAMDFNQDHDTDDYLYFNEQYQVGEKYISDYVLAELFFQIPGKKALFSGHCYGGGFHDVFFGSEIGVYAAAKDGAQAMALTYESGYMKALELKNGLFSGGKEKITIADLHNAGYQLIRNRCRYEFYSKVCYSNWPDQNIIYGPVIESNNFSSKTIIAYADGQEIESSVEDKRIVSMPTKTILSQNYPNPFNPETRINYSIAKSGNVKVMIYNMLGQKIITLIDEQKTTGHYSVNFNAENLESGIYFYRLTTNNYIKSKRMVLMK